MRRRELILAGAALVALALGMGLGNVLARVNGGAGSGVVATGELDPAAGVATSQPGGASGGAPAVGADMRAVGGPSTIVPATETTLASAAVSTPGSDAAAASSTAATAAPTSTTATAAAAPSSTTSTTRAAPAVTVASPTPSTSPAAGLNRMEQGVLDAVNAARQRFGCPPLTVDASLQSAAHAYAALMVSEHWFDHRSPDGKSPTDRAKAAGYQGGVGENLMMGFKDDPTGAVTNPSYGWLQSDGHRANILNCDYRRTGVGYDPGNIQSGYADGSWVQMFG